VDHGPYYACARLVVTAAQQWDSIDGQASLQGVDLLHLQPRRFFNALYAWMVERVEEPEVFRAALYDPPPDREPTERQLEREAEDFAAFAAAFGAAPRSRGTLGQGGGAWPSAE
jgi:hypothetical protein